MRSRRWRSRSDVSTALSVAVGLLIVGPLADQVGQWDLRVVPVFLLFVTVVAITVLVAFSRTYRAQRYPSDVIWGETPGVVSSHPGGMPSEALEVVRPAAVVGVGGEVVESSVDELEPGAAVGPGDEIDLDGGRSSGSLAGERSATSPTG